MGRRGALNSGLLRCKMRKAWSEFVVPDRMVVCEGVLSANPALEDLAQAFVDNIRR